MQDNHACGKTHWACGSNAGSGCLGVGHLSDCTEPVQVDLDSDQIVSIEAGGNHAAWLLMRDTFMFAGILTVDGYNHQFITPVQCHISNDQEEPISTRKVACGWAHTALLTDQGKVYVFGDNSYNQMGTDALNPIILHVGDHVKIKLMAVESCIELQNIISGPRHLFAWTDNSVHGWGWNRHSNIPLNLPSDTNYGYQVLAMSAGFSHSLMLLYSSVTDTIKLFECGKNKFTNTAIDEWSLVGFDNELKGSQWRICSGWSFNVLYRPQGSVYTWGRNDMHQCGNTDIQDAKILRPTLSVNLSGKLDTIRCGAEHCAAIGDDKLWTWGWNEHSVCGRSQDQSTLEPGIMSTASAVKSATCGYGSTFFETSTG